MKYKYIIFHIAILQNIIDFFYLYILLNRTISILVPNLLYFISLKKFHLLIVYKIKLFIDLKYNNLICSNYPIIQMQKSMLQSETKGVTKLVVG